MNRLRDPQWVLILFFLGIISGVPAIQALREAFQEESVRAIDAFPRSLTAANLRAYEHNLEGANWAAKMSRPWLQYGLFAWLNDGGSKATIAGDGWYFYKPGLTYMLSKPDPVPSGSTTNDPLPAIIDFRDQLASRGIHLVVMPVPNKESVYPDHLTSRARHLKGVLAPRTQDLLRRLREVDVACIDLFEAFSQARNQAGSDTQAPLYLAQDTHWSPAGVKLAAQTAARQLVERGLIRPGPPIYEERTVPIQRLGDILRMLQAPLIERRLSPETVACRQVVRRDNQEPFRETPNAEILVLGDSFTRIYQQDEPGSAGFAAHLAKELGQPLQVLVNDGGGSTLVRQELASRPAFLKDKKVLFWEFVERDIGLGREGWSRVKLPPAPTSTPSPPPTSAQGPGGGSSTLPSK